MYETFRTFCCAKHFPLNWWFNYSFCICHVMLKPNWNNLIIRNGVVYSPQNGEQTFWYDLTSPSSQFMHKRRKTIPISKVYVIMRSTLYKFPPKNWFPLFTLGNFIISRHKCSFKHALFVIKWCFFLLCVFPSHPLFTTQFVMCMNLVIWWAFVRGVNGVGSELGNGVFFRFWHFSFLLSSHGLDSVHKINYL